MNNTTEETKMTKEVKDVDAKIDEAEAAIQKYASKDTVISIGGYAFTPAKLMVAGAIVSSILGSLYGAFEIYKDYMDMKEKIEQYVSPDLSEIYKKIEVLDANTSKMVEYTDSIKIDLKSDVRRLEGVVENVERSSKTDQRLTDSGMKEIKRDVDASIKEIKSEVDGTVKEIRRNVDVTVKEIKRDSDNTLKEVNRELTKNQKETISEIRALRVEVDNKIKKALDNPLSN
jgi:DNA anti-recombination protein RmuC